MSLIQKGMRNLSKSGIIVTIHLVILFIRSILSKKFYTYIVRKTAKKVGPNLTVNRRSQVTDLTVLGNNVNFNGIRVHGRGNLVIGDNFHSGVECLVITQNHNYDNGTKIPYDSTIIEKPVRIEDNVWIGSRVTILPGVRIGEGAIIQGGSTVTTDIPKGAIAGGHPAEVFDHRDMDHYNQLKSENKFH